MNLERRKSSSLWTSNRAQVLGQRFVDNAAVFTGSGEIHGAVEELHVSKHGRQGELRNNAGNTGLLRDLLVDQEESFVHDAEKLDEASGRGETLGFAVVNQFGVDVGLIDQAIAPVVEELFVQALTRVATRGDAQ